LLLSGLDGLITLEDDKNEEGSKHSSNEDFFLMGHNHSMQNLFFCEEEEMDLYINN